MSYSIVFMEDTIQRLLIMTKKELLKEYRSFKRKMMKEYRVSRPSDITGGKGMKLNRTDFSSLMKNIKHRISQGEKKQLVVKDELLKYWKNKSHLSSDVVMKKLKSKGLVTTENEVESSDDELNEGGGMFEDVGVIHRDEVEPTVKKIEEALNIPTLLSQVVGSTGKKEYSGDIDIAINIGEDITEFQNTLLETFGKDNVNVQGKLLSIRAPIVEYNCNKHERKPRTGFVQVDFINGNVPWLKFFYFSPDETESKLKGAHRNMAITALSAFLDREESDELDDHGRPITVTRWKWSPKNGFFKIKRESVLNNQGRWNKKRLDTAISEEIYDPEIIVSTLFNGNTDISIMDSVESIVKAINENYDAETCSKIFSRMAENFKNNHSKKIKPLTANDVPEEIGAYF